MGRGEPTELDQKIANLHLGSSIQVIAIPFPPATNLEKTGGIIFNSKGFAMHSCSLPSSRIGQYLVQNSACCAALARSLSTALS